MSHSVQTENRIQTCHECQIEFEVVRLDQKFCTRKCRNRFNNRLVRQETAFTKRVDKILHKNRKLLAEFVNQKINITDLESYGFNFSYLTKLKKKNELDVFFCYEYYYYIKGDFAHVFKAKKSRK